MLCFVPEVCTANATYQSDSCAKLLRCEPQCLNGLEAYRAYRLKGEGWSDAGMPSKPPLIQLQRLRTKHTCVVLALRLNQESLKARATALSSGIPSCKDTDLERLEASASATMQRITFPMSCSCECSVISELEVSVPQWRWLPSPGLGSTACSFYAAHGQWCLGPGALLQAVSLGPWGCTLHRF